MKRPPARQVLHELRPSRPSPSGAEVELRAWRCMTAAGRTLTSPELAGLAGITTGAALLFLTGWTRAGAVRRGTSPPGRYAPYAAPYTACIPAGATPPTSRPPTSRPAGSTSSPTAAAPAAPAGAGRQLVLA